MVKNIDHCQQGAVLNAGKVDMPDAVSFKGIRRTPLDPSAAKRLFSEFKESAFRLELLPQYIVKSEEDDFAAFRRGESESKEKNASWVEYVREQCSHGKTMERVHIIPRELTDYLRYEILWGYVFSAEAGEKIFFVYEDGVPSRISPTNLQDYWLFDSEVALFQKYDEEGRWLGGELVEARCDIELCKKVRDDLLKSAFPLSDLLVELL